MIKLTHALELFIRAASTKKRIQSNGKYLTIRSIKNYLNLKRLIANFEVYTSEVIEIQSVKSKSGRSYKKEKNYWTRFQRNFSNYLFNTLGHFDNYVGTQYKLLRSLFRWLELERGIELKQLRSLFPIYKEDIQITVLNPAQLKFLINDQQFEQSLCGRLQRVKDIMVFGCTVALRASDLLNLNRTNLIHENGKTYLVVQSKKTNARTQILLPHYAIQILNKYRSRSHRILPRISVYNLNKYMKELCEIANWNEVRIKTRTRRGVPIGIYKDKAKKTHYRYYDHISSHTMRRTAITTMLQLGMDEWNVRQISGHSAGSKEFYRYVKLSQESTDLQTSKVHRELQEYISIPCDTYC